MCCAKKAKAPPLPESALNRKKNKLMLSKKKFVCNPKDIIPPQKNGLFTILLLLKKEKKAYLF